MTFIITLIVTRNNTVTTQQTTQNNTLTTHFALSATNRAHCRAYRSVPAFLRNLKFLVDLVSRFQKQTCADTFSPHSFTDCLRRAPPPLEWQAPSATHTAAEGVCGRGLIQRWRQKVGAAFVLNFLCACELEPQTGSTGSAGVSSESVCPRCV